MKLRHCALLLLSVWAFAQVPCNDHSVIQPLIDRSDSSFDFVPLSGPESHEREHFSIAEPLSLFPLSAGGAKDYRNRDESHVPTSPGPLITLGGHRADEYRQDISANNVVQQSNHEELLSLFPLAPGGARAYHERDWNTIAEQGHVPNSPGPITLGEHHADEYLQDHSAHKDQQSAFEEPLRVAINAPEEGKNSRKRVRKILFEEDHVPNRPRISEPHDDGHHQDLSAEDREQPATSVKSSIFTSLTNRVDKARPNLPKPEESSPVSQNDLRTAAPMNAIAEKHLSDSEKTMPEPHSHSRGEEEEVRSSSPQGLAEGGHVPNRPGPINTGTQDEAQPVGSVAAGGRTDNRKRVRELVSQEDDLLNGRAPVVQRSEWLYPQHFLDNKRQDVPPYTNRRFPSSITRFDGARLHLPNPEEPGAVYRIIKQTAAPYMDFTAGKSLLHAETTTSNPQSGSPSMIKTKRELKEFWDELSKQTREWTPPPISEKARLAAYFMAIHFQRALSNISGEASLQHLNRSNRILIPFAYRLLMKPLNTENWARILLVWRNLWHEEKPETEFRRRSDGEVLKKFLWISNFICESTLPELYGHMTTSTSIRLRFTRPESRTINILSDGRKELVAVLGVARQADMEHLRKILIQECYEGDQNSAQAASWESDPSVWMPILADLNRQAVPITPEPTEIDELLEKGNPKTYLFGRDTWNRRYRLPYGPVPAQPCHFLHNFPGGLKTEIRNLFERTGYDSTVDLQVQAYPIPAKNWEELIRRLEVHLDYQNKAPSTSTHGSFLPNRLHQWLDEKIKIMRIKEAEKMKKPSRWSKFT
ncbi:hypothetical protein PtA15_5A581 [Puccinia triticina]|uniref:Uncharacterized protein n=1 Tax=Puccinia triticina TaxID=208348 RepID=A0ABY7CJD1_9BASI|nr:uncharacterized protein PtA15_5A581 [Puccinia triticina]WAQ85008.1 hypothetical protein PtA15_5A581 [Puccinia triticina]